MEKFLVINLKDDKNLLLEYPLIYFWDGTDDIDEYIKQACPCLYKTFEWGAKYGKKILGNKHNVSKLLNFTFDLSKTGDYPITHILTVQDWLRRRVSKFLEM